MILYHFTAEEYLDSILSAGLTRGEVPLSATDVLNAVWLTSDRNPSGHGLTNGGVLSAEERRAFLKIHGKALPIRSIHDGRKILVTMRNQKGVRR